jgi:hypothetical protein
MKVYEIDDIKFIDEYLIFDNRSGDESFAFKKEDVIDLEFIDFKRKIKKTTWSAILEKTRRNMLKSLGFVFLWLFPIIFLTIWVNFDLEQTMNWWLAIVFISICAFSLFFVTCLLNLLNIPILFFSNMLFGEEPQGNFTLENNLKIIDTKNITYLFSLNERLFSYNSDKLYGMLDFFNYQLTEISNYGITILNKKNSEKEKFTYNLQVRHEINKYGLDKIWFLTGVFIFYFVIFLYCFFSTFIISGPETNFPTLIVIIPLIFSIASLTQLINGIYKRFKRKTFFNTSRDMEIKFSGSQTFIDEISKPKNTNLISIEIKDKFILTFEGILNASKINSSWNVNTFSMQSEMGYSIYTNDISFEKWWKDNFGLAGMTKNSETLNCFTINKDFYNKFGISSFASSFPEFQYERALCTYFYINKQ